MVEKAFIENSILLSHVLGMDNFCDDIALMLGEKRRPGKFWQICWKYISPLILLGNYILFSNHHHHLP